MNIEENEEIFDTLPQKLTFAQRKKLADPKIVEDLIHYFSEKRRLTTKNYDYRPSDKWDDYFREAALLCEEYELPPSTYIQKMYERIEYKKEFFNPEQLRGIKAAAFLKNLKDQEHTSFKVEITNASLDYAELWEHQENLAKRLLLPKETYEDLMLDSSLKFFGWFRVLSPTQSSSKIIEKYAHIARKEMNQTLKDFLVQKGLDLDRISL